jgi:hypothetical protein
MNKKFNAKIDLYAKQKTYEQIMGDRPLLRSDLRLDLKEFKRV